MRSVTKNGRSIFLTAVLAIILVYLFSIVGFLFFKDDFLMEVDRLPTLSKHEVYMMSPSCSLLYGLLSFQLHIAQNLWFWSFISYFPNVLHGWSHCYVLMCNPAYRMCKWLGMDSSSLSLLVRLPHVWWILYVLSASVHACTHMWMREGEDICVYMNTHGHVVLLRWERTC